MVSAAPLYYIPDGIDTPPHIEPTLPRFALHAGAVLVDGHAGGAVLGGAPCEGGRWQRVSGGYYVRIDVRVEPIRRQRLRLLPHAVIESPAGPLRAPLLLGADFGVLEHLVHTHSHLDADGRLQLQERIEHEDLALRIRAAVLDDELHLTDHALWQLAADVLSVHYRITLPEAVAWGWLTEETVLPIIEATVQVLDETDEDGDDV